MESLYLEHLETIRNLVVAGWMLLALGWAAQLGFDAQQDRLKGKPKEFCKLHSRPVSECLDQHKVKP